MATCWWLPTLSWQGRNPVDDDGDGIPNTLASGEPVRLDRPLVTTPLGFAQEAALIAYLRRAGLQFDLTTDLAYAHGDGPSLDDYSGAALAGAERWVTPSFGDSLAHYVQQGGRILSFGIGSLQRTVTIDGDQALDPSRAHRVDLLDGGRWRSSPATARCCSSRATSWGCSAAARAPCRATGPTSLSARRSRRRGCSARSASRTHRRP